MRLVSWNVNGLRACLNKGFGAFFDRVEADIFCVQETKLQPEQIELDFPGYTAYWHSAEKKGYSGTAVFTRVAPLSVTYGLDLHGSDSEGRVITLDFGTYFLVNYYAPNSQRGLLRLEYRLGWEDEFRAYLCRLDRIKPVIFCGDANVAHQEIDLKNPAANRRNAGFTDEERAKMTQLLDAGFVDTFRWLYPAKRDAYTWWSYLTNARSRNAGWRIDYFGVSKSLSEHIQDALIYAEVTGSDHCPVGLEIF